MGDVEVLNKVEHWYNYDKLPEVQDYSDRYTFMVEYRDNVLLMNEKEFELLKNKWIDETRFVSNPGIKYSNKNYQKIIDFKYSAIPHIVNDLAKNYNDWFYALHEITGENPIKAGHAGDVKAMTKDWLEWIKISIGA